jgi:hypothetical protein
MPWSFCYHQVAIRDKIEHFMCNVLTGCMINAKWNCHDCVYVKRDQTNVKTNLAENIGKTIVVTMTGGLQ